MAEVVSAKRPLTAYFLWLNANRERLVKDNGTSDPKVIGTKGGEMWKSLSAAAKKPFEDEASQKKVAYDKFLATDEGKKALAELKGAKADVKAEKNQKAEAKAAKVAQKEEKKNATACKAAVKAVVKDDALKKPVSAYWMWLGDNRERITGMVGGKGSDVAKKGGELWKELSDAERQPYDKKAKEQKEAYDKYIATPEGAAALKAFKEATQAAKDEFNPKEVPAGEAAEPAKEAGEKRKAKDADVTAESGIAPKKAKGRPPKVQASQLGA